MKPEMISTKFKYFFDWYGQYIVFTTKKQCKEYLKTKPNFNRIKDLKEIGIKEWHKISEHPRDQVFEIVDGIAIPMDIKMIDSLDEIPKESEIHPTPLPYEDEKVWWDDEKGEYNTIDYAIQKQWQQRLQTLREKSIAEINFIDALDSVITRDEYRSLTADQQRELIRSWLYPTNDDGEIDELIEEIPTDVHYEPSEPNLSENNEVQDLTSIEFFVANVKSYHASVFGVYCSNCFESESTIAVTTNNYTMFEFCKPCYDKLKRAMIARDARS